MAVMSSPSTIEVLEASMPSMATSECARQLQQSKSGTTDLPCECAGAYSGTAPVQAVPHPRYALPYLSHDFLGVVPLFPHAAEPARERLFGAAVVLRLVHLCPGRACPLCVACCRVKVEIVARRLRGGCALGKAKGRVAQTCS